MTAVNGPRIILVMSERNYSVYSYWPVFASVSNVPTLEDYLPRKPEKCTGQTEDRKANVCAVKCLCVKVACLLHYTNKRHAGSAHRGVCMVTGTLPAVLTSLASFHQQSTVPLSPRRRELDTMIDVAATRRDGTCCCTWW